MTDIGTGFQPTSAPTVRRADIELRRRIAALEARMTVAEVAIAAFGLRGAHASFSFNANTTTPPTGNQLRLNNASQTAATSMYVAHTTFDGMDATNGLNNIRSGDLIYIQDFDNAATWVRYTVSGTPINHGSWHEFPIAWESGPANVPFQKIELMPLYPNTFP